MCILYEAGHCGNLEEAITCEYGLGMHKCWQYAGPIHEKDPKNACLDAWNL